jgi:hypothetical protein
MPPPGCGGAFDAAFASVATVDAIVVTSAKLEVTGGQALEETSPPQG